MTQAEVVDNLEQLLDLIPEFKDQMTLYRETPQEERTPEMLQDRLKRFIDFDEEQKQQRDQDIEPVGHTQSASNAHAQLRGANATYLMTWQGA